MAGTSEGGKKAVSHRDKNDLRQAASKDGQHSHGGGRSSGSSSKKSAAGSKGGERSGGGRY